MTIDLARHFCLRALGIQGADIEYAMGDHPVYHVRLAQRIGDWPQGSALNLCFNRSVCAEGEVYAGAGSQFLNELIEYTLQEGVEGALVATTNIPVVSEHEISHLVEALPFGNCKIAHMELRSSQQRRLCTVFFLSELSCIYAQQQYLDGVIIDLEHYSVEESFEVDEELLTSGFSSEAGSSIAEISEIMTDAQLAQAIDNAYARIEVKLRSRASHVKRKLLANLRTESARLNRYYEKLREDDRLSTIELRSRLTRERQALENASVRTRLEIRDRIRGLELDLSKREETNKANEQTYARSCQLELTDILKRHQIDLELRPICIVMMPGLEQEFKVRAVSRLLDCESNLVVTQTRPGTVRVLCNLCGEAMASEQENVLCITGHLVHSTCSRKCQFCDSYYCRECGHKGFVQCSICGDESCKHCSVRCTKCNGWTCPMHYFVCPTCGKEYCYLDSEVCMDCGCRICASDFGACTHGREGFPDQ